VQPKTAPAIPPKARPETILTLVLCPQAVPAPLEHHTPPQHLTHDELAERHGAGSDATEQLHAFVREHGLRLDGVDAAQRIARIAGTDEAVRAAFPAGVQVPEPLAGVVQFVLGFHDGPAARRRGLSPREAGAKAVRVRDFASAYGFAAERSAAGQTIAVIEFGGGFRHADIADFCRRNNFPMPEIEVVALPGAGNKPAPEFAVRGMLSVVDGDIRLAAAAEALPEIEDAQATVEVTMDLELLAALAPGARLVVYFAPPTEQGLYDALHRAIYSRHYSPDVLSISWGEPETTLSAHYIHAVDHLLLAAARLGITVCASSGDAGALNHSPDKLPAVNFPAGSPHCLACGGTTPTFTAHAGGRTELAREVVWNSTHYHLRGATGGGVSRVFGVPAWQAHADVPVGPTGFAGRGVPDVAGPADPRSGCELRIYDVPFASAGTSAAAPLWAALIACCNQALGGRLGHVNPHLYSIGHQGLPGLRPVTDGHNDGYAARAGWNACTGWGSPAAADLIAPLAALLRLRPASDAPEQPVP
jgi:kumamolisin